VGEKVVVKMVKKGKFAVNPGKMVVKMVKKRQICG